MHTLVFTFGLLPTVKDVLFPPVSVCLFVCLCIVTQKPLNLKKGNMER